jgi:hypothetical protein
MNSVPASSKKKIIGHVLAAVVAAIFGAVSGLWSTYALASVNKIWFAVCLVAATWLGAAGTYLFFISIHDAMQDIHVYVQAKKRAWEKTHQAKWGGFIFGLTLSVVIFGVLLGVYGYFTFQLLSTQLHGLLINQFHLPHLMAKDIVLVVVGVVVPFSLATTFFDWFKSIFSKKSGVEGWCRRNGKHPLHWIMFTAYAAGSFFLAWPLVGVLLAGHVHFNLFVMNQFYLPPVSMVAMILLVMSVSFILLRSLIMLHVMCHGLLTTKASRQMSVGQIIKLTFTIIASVLVAMASLWTINRYKILGGAGGTSAYYNEGTQTCTVLARSTPSAADSLAVLGKWGRSSSKGHQQAQKSEVKGKKADTRPKGP